MLVDPRPMGLISAGFLFEMLCDLGSRELCVCALRGVTDRTVFFDGVSQT